MKPFEFDLNSYFKQKQAMINDRIGRLLTLRTLPGRLSEAMSYAVTAGGKRIRPILCLAAQEALRSGSSIQDAALTAGCAIECIHTYSLIHDDLPAMDNDTLRRGMPTCHVAFDEATAILAGDALLTLGFEILASPPPKRLKCAAWMRVIHIISRAAGCRGMVEGQMRDMAAEGKKIPLEELERLHSLKTGALIRASVEAGAVLAGAKDSELEKLSEYADKLGTAFQVTDDMLNVSGNPEKMGKAVGSDTAKQKSTYPALIGLDASREKAEALVSGAVAALNGFDEKADPLRAIARYVLEREK